MGTNNTLKRTLSLSTRIKYVYLWNLPNTSQKISNFLEHPVNFVSSIVSNFAIFSHLARTLKL